MNVTFLNPFVQAAHDVLRLEINAACTRGKLSLQQSSSVSEDVNVLISLVGQVRGLVLYGMSETTALELVSRIMNEPLQEFDALAQSGIGELGNVITGRAAAHLSDAGYEVEISPPSLVLGKGTLITTIDIDRVVVPLETEAGMMHIHLALKAAN